MISLNGIQIAEADLKRQLEAQGYLAIIQPPSEVRHYWEKRVHFGQDCFGYARTSISEPLETIPDELIRAYEKLHKYSGELGAEASCHNLFIISAAIYKKIQNMYGEINALKAQGEKR